MMSRKFKSNSELDSNLMQILTLKTKPKGGYVSQAKLQGSFFVFGNFPKVLKEILNRKVKGETKNKVED